MILVLLVLACLLPAPRPAPAAIPTAEYAVVPERPSSGNLPERTEAPDRPQDALSGRASWFRAPSTTAAAGPALRAALGPHWRGMRVAVTGPEGTAVVQLLDWCQCYRGERGERLIDLSDEAFQSACGPLAIGICRVRVSGLVPPATDTAP